MCGSIQHFQLLFLLFRAHLASFPVASVGYWVDWGRRRVPMKGHVLEDIGRFSKVRSSGDWI